MAEKVTMAVDQEMDSKKSGGMVWWILIIVVLAVVALWWTGILSSFGGTSTYQAVFLSNNQVYFGILTNRASQYPVLKNVYYLQVTQALQPRPESEAIPNVNLVKLGGELHGPTDRMVINRDQILFYEDLRADSQVVKAIDDYQKNQ